MVFKSIFIQSEWWIFFATVEKLKMFANLQIQREASSVFIQDFLLITSSAFSLFFFIPLLPKDVSRTTINGISHE
jgi:hypothetical protein